MLNFWDKFRDKKRPFFALAPMEAVTDVVFRETVAHSLDIAKRDANVDYDQPLYFTEFTNATSFCHDKGEVSTRGRLTFSPDEIAGNFADKNHFEKKFPRSDYDPNRFLVAQIWGEDPANFELMTTRLFERGFSGVDINMGCPDKNVVHGGAGSGLIDNPDLAIKLISAAQSGWINFAKNCTRNDPTFAQEINSAFPDFTKLDTSRIPVSVKTRLGARKTDEFHDWLPKLLNEKPANLTVHLRTRKEMSKVPAHFELIPEIVKIRDETSPRTLLTINGDILSRKLADELREKYPGVDGFMIGRGVFNNPFVFTDIEPTREQLFELLRFQLDKYDEFREIAHSDNEIITRKFDPLKHFFKIYTNGFIGAKKLREQMMATNTTDEVRQILNSFENS